MDAWTRRRFLSTSAVGMLGLAATSCSSSSPKTGQSAGTLTWWDNFNALQDLHAKTLQDFSAAPGGIPTKYTFYQLAKYGQALQLAKQSNQQPDVHTTANLATPLPVLIDGGWFQPLDLADEVLARFDEDDLVDGIHRFDGKLYSFPLFSNRWHNAALWFRTELLDKVGATPPKTFDEFRTVCGRARKAGDGVSGWVAGLNAKNPYFLVLNALAQAAGFQGSEGLDFRTGEIRYTDDAYLQVFELFDSLRKDKLMFAGATSSNAIQARGRWAANSGIFFFDGPYQVGSVKRDFPKALDGMGLAGLMSGDAAGSPQVYRPTAPGALYLAKSSTVAAAANKLLGSFTTPEYYAGLAAAMDQPPRDLTAVSRSEATHPLYKELCAQYAKHTFTAPSAVVGNPDVAKVNALMKAPAADLGDIFRGVMSGEITDYRAALAKLSGQSMADREKAIKAAAAKGAQVSADDWTFPNWKPGADYTAAMYEAR
ncbi:carbohydrate ABC transporter substrate-binding protein [Kribbella turkmenica]|uniref:Carbohydrate ABC transporter substrate-binding protein n=1 Tax=Kribbella turkmenica TaxID=2530375 RepID=A0A4R4WN04_9ACTN|nr:ABC transporter substrate-binding protein [Kribbella turkmenica]TDD20071.1 carbohydrate ABC transporter substrate-binding protein [Kribbella turkmenica]